MGKLLRVVGITIICCVTGLGQMTRDQLIESANRLNDSGSTAEAIAVIDKLIALEPSNPQSYIIRARFFKAAKEEAKFYADLDTAVALAPNNKEVLETVVRKLREVPKSEACEKVSALTSAFLKTSPADAKILSLRSGSRQCLNDSVGALDDISTAAKLDPENWVYQVNLANALGRLASVDEADAIYQKTIGHLERILSSKSDPVEREAMVADLASIYLSRAFFYERAGEKPKTIEFYTKAIRMVERPTTLERRAATYGAMRMFPEAIADLTRTIKLLSESWAADGPQLPARFSSLHKSQIARLLSRRADYYVAANKSAEAISDYEQCSTLDPELKPSCDSKRDRLREPKTPPNR